MNSIINHLCPVVALVSVSLSTATELYAADPANVDPQRFNTQPTNGPSSWSGFYAGVNVDAFGTVTSVEKGGGNQKFKNEEASALLGIHFGYNFEPFGNTQTGGWMMGLETDVSFGNTETTKTDPILGTVKLENNFTTSTRARAGFAWSSLYLYGTAGLAISDYNLKSKGNSDTDINIGVAAGIGAEYAFSNDWSVRAEAIGYDFGEPKFIFNGTERAVDLDAATFRVGLTKRF